MTRLNERIVDSRYFKRRKASADTKRKIANWDIWDCADPEFEYDYARRVSLYVHQGAVELTFSDGEVVDLQPGDFLTIEPGARPTWKITAPIRNSYVCHETFESASRRASQFRWQNK